MSIDNKFKQSCPLSIVTGAARVPCPLTSPVESRNINKRSDWSTEKQLIPQYNSSFMYHINLGVDDINTSK